MSRRFLLTAVLSLAAVALLSLTSAQAQSHQRYWPQSPGGCFPPPPPPCTFPYPGPYPGQPYPGQPYPGQPYPGQPYPGQGWGQFPGQPYPGQGWGPFPIQQPGRHIPNRR